MPRRVVIGDPPTEDQLIVFGELYQSTLKRGYQPSLGELGEALGRAPSTVAACLEGLRRRGWLGESDGLRSRAVVILRTPSGRPFRGFAEASGEVASHAPAG